MNTFILYYLHLKLHFHIINGHIDIPILVRGTQFPNLIYTPKIIGSLFRQKEVIEWKELPKLKT